MGKRGRPKNQNPLTEQQVAERKAFYNANRRRARHRASKQLKEELREWKEVGWIVRKMNREAGISQEQIWELLGGLVIRKKIKKWCAENFKMC